MSGTRITHRSGLRGGRSPWIRWRRPLIPVLLLQLASAGCLGGMKPPRSQQEMERYLREHEDQLAAGGITPAEASARLAGAARRTGSAGTTDDAAATPGQQQREQVLPATALPVPEESQSWKVVDGVAEYRLGTGDVIRIISYVGPDVDERQVSVETDGTVYVPRFGIGSVPAAGLTPTELSRELTSRFQPFAPEARIQVEVQDHRAWTATLLGEIRFGIDAGSGDYALEGRTTVAEFIYDHGGPTPNGDLADVRLVRDDREYSLDLSSARSQANRQQNPWLAVGDVVLVPSRQVGTNRYYVLGEVGQPGIYSLTEGARVLDAVSQAGSFTQFADLDEAFVSRPGNGAPQVIPVDLETIVREGRFEDNLVLQPGDFVFVPRKPAGFFERARDIATITTLVISIITIIEVTRRD